MTDDEATAPTATASNAFAALGDEVRVGILEALADARSGDPTDRGLTFSELRDRVGVEDSGRFNYHLGKLRGRFVEEADEADDADGYVLTYAGSQVVGAILAGTYGTGVEHEPEPLDDPCPVCDGTLTADYRDGELSVDCENDHTLLQTTVAPGVAADRSTGALVTQAVRTTYARMELLAAGICPECSGRVDRSVEPAPEGVEFEHTFRTTCSRCGAYTASTAGAAVLREPAFVAFCHDHGIDLTERLPWTLPVLTDGETVRTSEDPPRYRIHAEAGDEALDLTLDERGVVLDAERSDG